MTLSEAEVAAHCDGLAGKLGWQVERYEQRRASHIKEGLPDRRYVRRGYGCRLWVELKGTVGKLTEDQHLWLLDELAAGGFAAVICDALELAPLLQGLAKRSSIQDNMVRDRCRQLVDLCVQRGYRAVKKRVRPGSW